METHREQKINDLRARIERGEYMVDAAGTADAIVHCVSALALAQADGRKMPVSSHERRRLGGRVGGAARRCRGMKTALVAAVR